MLGPDIEAGGAMAGLTGTAILVGGTPADETVAGGPGAVVTAFGAVCETDDRVCGGGETEASV